MLNKGEPPAEHVLSIMTRMLHCNRTQWFCVLFTMEQVLHAKQSLPIIPSTCNRNQPCGLYSLVEIHLFHTALKGNKNRPIV